MTSTLPLLPPLLIASALVVGLALLYDWLRRPAPLVSDADEQDVWPGEVSSGGPGEAPGKGRVQAFLVRAGIEGVTGRDLALFALACGAACGVAAQVLLGWGVVSFFAVALGLLAPVVYFAHRRERRRAAWQAALADAVDQLRDGIHSGLSVEAGLSALAANGPVALRGEFRRLVREQQAAGFAPALEAMRQRVADAAFDSVAVTLTVNDGLGSQRVGQVLDQLARATRTQLRVREEVRATQARNVASARIIAAVPLVLLVAVRRLNPLYVAVFDTGGGQLLLAGCLLVVALGYAVMVRMARLPQDQRVLV